MQTRRRVAHLTFLIPPRERRRRSGLTLVELTVVVIILFILGIVLFPVYPRPCRGCQRRTGCLSNLKQVGLAIMMYVQDFDDRYPIAGHSLQGPYWEGGQDSLLNPYVKNAGVFRCPSIERERPPRLTYMYNDLSAGEHLNQFVAPSVTVLVMESNDMAANVGHARVPRATPAQPGVVNERGICDPDRGGTAGAALARHRDGANYLFADGHAIWLMSGNVYFPPRSSNSRAHKERGKTIGPDPDANASPSGRMTFHGKEYKATLHIR